MTQPTKIIDLFSGPGGLGEGFSANKKFKIAISIEKEPSAHRTLLLRAFYRQFDVPPIEYYQFLKGNLGSKPEDELYKLPKFKKEIEAARKEALCLELGKDNDTIQKEIDAAIGKDDCILIGGPPCQAYSLVGRARNSSITNYKAEDDHRNFLYLEYLKVIARYQPKVFVMENVKGMLSAKINGQPIFDQIKADLEDPSKTTNELTFNGRKKQKYRIVPVIKSSIKDDLLSKDVDHFLPKDYIIKSENYGIPQKRHRVILLGLREDIAEQWSNNLMLKPCKDPVSIKDVIDDLPKLRSGLSKLENTADNWTKTIQDGAEEIHIELSNTEFKPLALAMKEISLKINSPEIEQGLNLGLKISNTTKILENNTQLKKWLIKEKMDGYITNHQTRGHLAKDLNRYLFCSTWAQLATKLKWSNPFPKSRDYPNILKPNHKNFDTGKFADRFRCQVSQSPATTITSHISKDGHYYIHYDPLQCRSLTVREAARIQTFPDDYFFVGNRTQQYVQVGNAVPPYLANKISEIVSKILEGIKT